MKARQIINESLCSDEARRTIGQAFDEGWRIIGAYFSDDHSEVEAVRVKLARTLLMQAGTRTQVRDAEELKDAALVALGWLEGRHLTSNSAPGLKKVA